MAFFITDQRIGGQPVAVNDATQKHPLGLIVTGRDEANESGEFIYLLGVASTALADWVTYNADDFSTTRLVADAVGPVAIAMAATVADEYGWYQIGGKALGACKTAFADNGFVFITGTAGAIDDASVTGDLVNLAKGASTTVADSLVADFEIHRPYVNNNSVTGG